jgi:hypothetical protein
MTCPWARETHDTPHFFLNALLQIPTQAMADSKAPIDGPFSLPEFRRRLVAGQIDRNTVVRMPNGDRWMLLPSFLDSPPQSRGLTTRRERLRSASAYRSFRWLVVVAAWLCYGSALHAALSEESLIGWLFGKSRMGLSNRPGLALLLVFLGLFVQFGGAMVVDLFDLLLGVGVFRMDRAPEKNQSPQADGESSSKERGPQPECSANRGHDDSAGR